ncbi:hypothetical protein BX616_003465 [Lobosporangium transversale]|nr:hypothetical protein BX616_003465 [Lobosporangium transversale]
MPSDIRVTIVGGGIGGLALANMFEKANISYIILEKATQIKALGSSLGLDATTLPVMEQLGLLEDFYRASNPVRHFNFYNEHLKPIGKVDFSDLEEIGGYPAIILDRPSFYNILLKNLPKDKILYNKRVLSIVQDTEGVTVKCADGSIPSWASLLLGQAHCLEPLFALNQLSIVRSSSVNPTGQRRHHIHPP